MQQPVAVVTACSGPVTVSPQVFQVAYVIIKAANAPRPGGLSV